MKPVILILTPFLLFSCAKNRTVSEMDTADRVQKIVNSSQAILPLKLDNHIRLDRIEAKGNELIHHYTLIDIDNMIQLDWLSSARLINDTCNNVELHKLISNGVTVHDIYRDVQGYEIKSIRIDRWDCDEEREAAEDW